MTTLHLHGWQKAFYGNKRIFVCCASPSCFVTRNWKDILHRYATCTQCFNRFIVLGYQAQHRELLCHACNHHELTKEETFRVSRLEIEGNKDEFIRLVLCKKLAKGEDSLPLDDKVGEELPEINIPLALARPLRKELEEIATVTRPPESFLFAPPKTDRYHKRSQSRPKKKEPPPEKKEVLLTENEEHLLKVAIEKKLKSLLEKA